MTLLIQEVGVGVNRIGMELMSQFDLPKSDLSRFPEQKRNEDWPETVKIALHWIVEGRTIVRAETITADQFFGKGSYGAPLDGQAIIGMIERMRREGPPKFTRKRRNV